MTTKLEKLRSLLDRVTTRAAEPRPARAPVAAAAAPADQEEIPAEELEELDLSSGEVVQEPVEMLDEADFGEIADVSEADIEVEEEAPESAPRPASSIGEALDGVADSYQASEPLKTPPPESGRQEMTPPPPPPHEGPEVALETDTSGAPLGRPSGAAPTTEQLGQVVELEGAAPAELELDAAKAASPPPAQPDRPVSHARPPSPTAEPADVRPAQPSPSPKTFVELLDAALSL